VAYKGFHACRHSGITRMLKTMPMDVVQKIAGHSRISITVDIYGHQEPRDWAAQVAQAFERPVAMADRFTPLRGVSS
jgi:integrase